MEVRLISVTRPLIDGLNSAEDLIVHNARVSNPNNQLNIETGAKLLNYCIKNAHWSIFEQADMTVEIKTSRAIAAQILRHKSFSFQELSQRYSQVSEFEDVSLRLQGKTNRQVGDVEYVDQEIQEKINKHITDSNKLYQEMIDKGIAKECARFILPLNTRSVLYMKGSARSWIHYFDVRCSEHTQKEHRDISIAIREIFKKQFPVISEALSY